MDRVAAKKEICRRWREIIPHYTDIAKDKANGEPSYICPLCGHGEHGDGLTFNPQSKADGLKCFGCGFTGNIIDLVMKITGEDFKTAENECASLIGITIDGGQNGRMTAETAFNDKLPDAEDTTREIGQNEPQRTKDFREYYIECQKRLNDPAAISYLTGRGISVETARLIGAGFDPAADPANAPGAAQSEYKPHPAPRLIFPSSPSHYVARAIDPNTPKQYAKMNPARKMGAGEPGIINELALWAPDVSEVFVFEGVFNMLSVMETGEQAIALNSTSNRNHFLKVMEKAPTEATLILCMDNDSAGKKATDELRQGLQRLNIPYIIGDVTGGHNDANDFLQADREGFIAAVAEAKRKASARPDGIADYINDFMQRDIDNFKDDVKTGFPNLDAAEAAGGLYAGLYVVAAISSLGKTTFCAQLADQIAAAGHDVLFFSLEQSRLEMTAKSIARIMAQKNRESTVTSLQIRKGTGGRAAEIAAQEYITAVGNRLSVIEGNFNCDVRFIGDYIRRYVQRNNTRPVVFIDYLQILQPEQIGNRQQTTKETVDTAVTELKRISREMNLTVFVISSVNRSNYLTPIDFESLKESGGIEYSADVVWGLQLQCLRTDPAFMKKNPAVTEMREVVRQAKAATPRKIELVCLKNRYGKSSYSCCFDYFPQVDLFEPDYSAVFPESEPTHQQKKAGRKR